MSRRTVKVLVFIALAALYAYLCFHGTRIVGAVGAPRWWMQRFPSNLSGAYTWFSIARIATIALVALPIGAVCAYIYRGRHIMTAAAIGVLTFVMLKMPLLAWAGSTDALMKLTMFLDFAVFILAPVAITKLVTSNISLQRDRFG
jgi:hypothetical protein